MSRSERPAGSSDRGEGHLRALDVYLGAEAALREVDLGGLSHLRVRLLGQLESAQAV